MGIGKDPDKNYALVSNKGIDIGDYNDARLEPFTQSYLRGIIVWQASLSRLKMKNGTQLF